jgi:hypothetical protein
MSLPIPPPTVWPDASEEAVARRMWAAVMLSADFAVCGSILAGRPVLARQLDAEVLRRALRGAPLPAPDSYFRVRHGHLDAIAEGGPFDPKARRR